MPDAFTGVGAVTLDQTAYDLAVYHGLRNLLYYDAFADVESTAQSFEGATVIFTIVTDLSPATTTLAESTDVNAVAMANSQVTLTLAEYGNAVIYTKLLRSSSFVPFDPVAANLVAWNAGQSQDLIARNTLQAGSNVRYSGNATSRDTVGPDDTIVANQIRRAVAELRGASVMDFGGNYAGAIHPDTSYDLRIDTGAAGWLAPHTYSQPDEIWKGEIGQFNAVRFVETPSAPLFADAGSSTTLTDVYGTLIMGRQALAKGFGHTDGNGPYPMFVPGPVTDKLRRNVPLGWYWFGGYKIFREAALRRIESSSTIGSNA